MSNFERNVGSSSVSKRRVGNNVNGLVLCYCRAKAQLLIAQIEKNMGCSFYGNMYYDTVSQN